MQIVIDIPEEIVTYIKDYCGMSIADAKEVLPIILNAIHNGTPLPKGHGDLIDRNSILCNDLPCNLCGYTDECFKLLAPTIIEADKEQEHGT